MVAERFVYFKDNCEIYLVSENIKNENADMSNK